MDSKSQFKQRAKYRVKKQESHTHMHGLRSYKVTEFVSTECQMQRKIGFSRKLDLRSWSESFLDNIRQHIMHVVCTCLNDEKPIHCMSHVSVIFGSFVLFLFGSNFQVSVLVLSYCKVQLFFENPRKHFVFPKLIAPLVLKFLPNAERMISVLSQIRKCWQQDS